MITFFEHFPYALSHETAKVTVLTGFGTPGETVNLSFSICAEEDMPELVFEFSGLTCDSSSVPSSQVQIYIVKVWEQAGIGLHLAEAVNIPELLLKDDRLALQDGYVKQYKHWKHLLTPLTVYNPPDVPLTGPAKTSLQAHQFKQVWVSVTLPPDSSPGLYTGKIQVQCSQNASSYELPLEMEVYPFQLAEAKHILCCWYKGTLDWKRSPQHYVSEKTMRYQLQDIYDHGFRSILFTEGREIQAQKAIAIAEEIGFNQYVFWHPPYPNKELGLKMQKLTPVYYVSSELDAHCDEVHLKRHKKKWILAQRRRRKTMATLLSQGFARRFKDAADLGHAPDIISYYLPENTDYLYFYSQFPEVQQKEQPTLYYWMTHMEKPNVHRVLAGVYLWQSRAAGISPYGYQHLPRYPNSPFNDFEAWEPGLQIGEETRPFRHHMTTYPACRGTISTLQWEGVAEGITDLRYLTTLHQDLEKAKSSPDPKTREMAQTVWLRTEAFLKRIDIRNITVLTDTEREPYTGIQPHEYHEFRRQMANDIIALQLLSHSTPVLTGS
jgi:hypothetical protein